MCLCVLWEECVESGNKPQSVSRRKKLSDNDDERRADESID